MAYPIRNRPSRQGPSTPYGSAGPSSQPARSGQYTSASSGRPGYSSSASRQAPSNGYRPSPPAQPTTFRHPETYEPGPLPFFLAPPGQVSRDPALPPPRTQALYTTYPSRLRTGVSGLMQPDQISGGPRERDHLLAELERENALARSGSNGSTPLRDSPAPFTAKRPTTMSGRQTGRGGRINYAEKESDDEESESEEDDLDAIQEAPSDPEDETFGERRRNARDKEAAQTAAREWKGIGTVEQQAAMRAGKLRKKREEMDKGWTWLGDRVPGERVRGSHRRATKHEYHPEEILSREADAPEMLIPITIDFDISSTNPDVSGVRIKDRFLWNLNERFITPYNFAAIFCDDIGISAKDHAETIAELINAQVEEAQNAVEVDVTDREITADDVVWSEDEVAEVQQVEEDTVMAESRAVSMSRKTSGDGKAVEVAAAGDGEDAEGEPAELDGEDDEGDAEEEEVVVKERKWDEADCRIIVNLDVQIYAHMLRDRIEWDLCSPLSPAQFAKHYCADLGLTGEAVPLVAHAITDELLKHKRDALDLELFASTHPAQQAKWERMGGGLPRVNFRQGAKGLVGAWRDWFEREEYGPVLVELSMEEMERREVERMREARRMMRGVAGARRRR